VASSPGRRSSGTPRRRGRLYGSQQLLRSLEEQIATLLGYQDTRKIYDELDRRAEIIRQLIDADVLGYHEVNDAIAGFHRDGLEGLPIRISGIDQFA